MSSIRLKNNLFLQTFRDVGQYIEKQRWQKVFRSFLKTILDLRTFEMKKKGNGTRYRYS